MSTWHFKLRLSIRPSTLPSVRPRARDARTTGPADARGMTPTPEVAADKVDEASWESFPASDAPAWRR